VRGFVGKGMTMRVLELMELMEVRAEAERRQGID
jgi:hypothetical protein